MKVENILSLDPQFIGPDDTVAHAAQRMRSFEIGMLPVIEDDQLIGTLTDRDIVLRSVAEGRDAATLLVREIMTVGAVSCFDDEDIREAARRMARAQVRRLPVVNRIHRLIGVISLGDLAVRGGDDLLSGEILGRVSEPTRLESLIPAED